MKNIPIILPVFNQLTYLRNFLNWIRWYLPENPIYVIDNGSQYPPLLKYYQNIQNEYDNLILIKCEQNNFIGNLEKWLDKLIKPKYEYYVISDVDIQPHPSTPPNFLEIFKSYIENHNFHRAGFNLIINDIPDWLHDKAFVVGNESQFREKPILLYEGFPGHKAPLDTTFCLYTTKNRGWKAPMDGEDWGNCLRLFEAYHWGWYQHPDFVNEEMDFYYKSCVKHEPGAVSAGKNNNRPKQYNE